MSLRPLSRELQEKARQDLNEDPERIPEDIKYIKEWLFKQPHIKPRPEEQWLLSFLRGTKFSLEQTKQKIDYFYTMRTAIPEFYQNRDPLLPELQELLDIGIVLPLPKLNKNGERIILIRTGRYDAAKVNVTNILKIFLMILDILMNEDDDCLISGFYNVIDMKMGTMEHYICFSPATVKTFLELLQHAYPFRVRGFLFFNAPSYFEFINSLIRPVLDEKLRNRMSTASELPETENISVSLLPKEYGGEVGSINTIRDTWKRKVESYREWFIDDEKYRNQEDKRLGEPKTPEKIFGVAGSFRKLQVD